MCKNSLMRCCDFDHQDHIYCCMWRTWEVIPVNESMRDFIFFRITLCLFQNPHLQLYLDTEIKRQSLTFYCRKIQKPSVWCLQTYMCLSACVCERVRARGTERAREERRSWWLKHCSSVAHSIPRALFLPPDEGSHHCNTLSLSQCVCLCVCPHIHSSSIWVCFPPTDCDSRWQPF